MKYIIYTDGGSRGNPGPAAIGFIIYSEKGEVLKKYGEVIGEATNNEAEYRAVIFALKKFKALFGKEEAEKAELEIRMDSELVVKQFNHQYKIMEKNLQQFFIEIWNLLVGFGAYRFVAIPREQNKEADYLVNQALDFKQGEIDIAGL